MTESQLAKKHGITAGNLEKAKDILINSYLSDAQKVREPVFCTLEFMAKLCRAMGYKVKKSNNPEWFFIR